jgi:endonuclease YncB( thermonuclease family)
VIKVYDGDTITIAAQMYNGAVIPKKENYRFNVRLNGIDTPEIKTSNLAEHTLAIASRDALSTLVMGKVVRLENNSYDKYGRLLSDVFITLNNVEINVCKWMLEHNYAIVYNGGHKLEGAWD